MNNSQKHLFDLQKSGNRMPAIFACFVAPASAASVVPTFEDSVFVPEKKVIRHPQ